MASGFMGKKVNLFLLLMIILVLVGFGAISVYYQYTFKNINQKFDDKAGDLGTCELNLVNNMTELLKARSSLSSTTTDIRKYDVLYEQKAEALETKEGELSDTRAELTRVTMQKEVYKRQIDDAFAQIITLNQSIKSLGQQVNSLTIQLNKEKEKVACLINNKDADEWEECL
ncbi:MAG: hypothetical protein KKF46_00285 [Nanoarchaeota archaeon]|nr:hypothetical protein [Nanoarchaeota archaeon]MBU1320771.1 hypothetical protein [Nanoarchaeota archaeon]MBU1598138.1 hypothetical protein [Nanoarchaeota archaeon]MBU2442199.1 hypothetical protein [Nanoarchaeota archaeon]